MKEQLDQMRRLIDATQAHYTNNYVDRSVHDSIVSSAYQCRVEINGLKAALAEKDKIIVELEKHIKAISGIVLSQSEQIVALRYLGGYQLSATPSAPLPTPPFAKTAFSKNG